MAHVSHEDVVSVGVQSDRGICMDTMLVLVLSSIFFFFSFHVCPPSFDFCIVNSDSDDFLV